MDWPPGLGCCRFSADPHAEGSGSSWSSPPRGRLSFYKEPQACLCLCQLWGTELVGGQGVPSRCYFGILAPCPKSHPPFCHKLRHSPGPQSQR